MGLRLGWITFVLLGACVSSNETVCTGGRICPAGTECDDGHGLCISPGQRVACVGAPDREPCTIDDSRMGECDAGICLEQICGDGVVTGREECDGSTTADCASIGYYDSGPLTCSARCAYVTDACTGFCGDGQLNGPDGAEICDGGTPVGGCFEYGFEAGLLGCNEDFCAPDLTGCRNIGFVPFAPTSGNPIDAVFVGSPGQVVITDDYVATHVNGTVLTQKPLPLRVRAMWGTSATDLFATGYGGSIAHFDGSAWTLVRMGTGTSANLHGAWGAAANNIYAAGTGFYGSEIVHFDGTNWAVVDSLDGKWQDVWGANASNIRVVGAGGAIRRYTGTWSNEDASACWTSVPNLFGIWGSSESDVFVVGSGGTICHFNGTDWERQWTGVSTELHKVWGRAPNDVYAVGSGGLVLHYDGAQWWSLESGTPNDLGAIHGSSTDLVIAGAGGTVRRYAGAALAVDPFEEARNYIRLSAASPSGVYVLSIGSVWQRAATLDKRWTEVVPNDFNTEYAAIWADANGAGFVLDTFGSVHSSTNAWAPVATTLVGVPAGLEGRGPSDLYAFGESGGVAHYNGTWSSVTTTTDPFLELHAFSLGPTTVWAVGKDGLGKAAKLVGAQWVDLPLPAQTQELFGVYAASDTSVFAVGGGGVILHYDGTAWSPMVSGVLNDLYAISGTSETDVFAVGNNIVLHYDGSAWSPVAFPQGTNFADVAVTAREVYALSQNYDPIRRTVTLMRAPSW